MDNLSKPLLKSECSCVSDYISFNGSASSQVRQQRTVKLGLSEKQRVFKIYLAHYKEGVISLESILIAR